MSDRQPAHSAELSVYSMTTHQEQQLGQVQIRGNCTGIPNNYVCAGKDGFILFH